MEVNMPRLVGVLLALVSTGVFCVSETAYAQTGNIAGTVRDSSGGVLPGVTVEVTSPQLIEKVRTSVTDENGRYQIVSLPVGVYTVTFTLDRFARVQRTNVELTSDFTAPVNAELKPGDQKEEVTVVAIATLVDVQNARQRQVFTGDEIADLPTTRNLGDLIQLVPGIAISAAGLFGNPDSRPTICSGGQADGGFSGTLSGCGPIFEGFNAHSSMNDPASLNQGRLQVDGLGVQSFGGGGRSSYITDIGNAQEVTFTLSGSLGESETGGTTINVIPRTGGNRYAGNYFTAYSSGRFYDKNNETRTSNFSNRLIREYDVNGAFGGPLLRDRLWFYSAARRQDRDSQLTTNFQNLNAGVFGANYLPDLNAPVNQGDFYQNVNTRLTVQATRRDKFNIFWDEQYTCENPCDGSNAGISLEAQGSVLTYPLRVQQLSWTNPVTNRFLLDAGFGYYGSRRNESRKRTGLIYDSIPRISESGASTGYVLYVPDAVGNAITSGSLANPTTNWDIDNFQSRASASYITGSHNVKLGYQGQFLGRLSDPHYNDLRLSYAYATPAASCTPIAPAPGAVATQTWCGLFPDGVTRIFDGKHVSEPIDPACIAGTGQTLTNNLTNCPSRLQTVNRPPVPTSFTQYIPAGVDEKTWFASIYLQDQWTLRRFTLSGALRYDNAQSRFGKTCVGPDLFTQYPYCLNDPDEGDGRGVYYQDITPRWGVAWDVFGNGKTSLKYSGGKYLQGSQAGGIYTATNPASGTRSVNSLTRTWRDLDGDRIVDCDLSIPEVAPSNGLPANGECAAVTGGTAGANARRFGRSPDNLDDLGLAIGLNTMYCGQYESSMSPAISLYCDNYLASGGKTLLDGWGKRQYEWQTSIGVQHELLPRLSAEVTYNRRNLANFTVTDTIGAGCDLYSITPGVETNAQQCMQDLLNFQSNFYDFYGVRAPLDARLPGGGGFVVQGIATPQCGTYSSNPGEEHICTAAISIPAGAGVDAVVFTPDGAQYDYWSGVDTNFVWRGRGGMRVSAGTSTGRRNVGICGVLTDNPPTGQILMEGRERDCDRIRPYQTNVRGTASYTIPWIDVLVSSAFSSRPGVQINANYTVDLPDLVWGPNSQHRTGTTLAGSSATTVTRNLLSNDEFGERITLVDLKLAKNIRFLNKRVNIGFDLFNVFNVDAALSYCATFPNPDRGVEGCGSGATLRPWKTVDSIVTPRYGRFQIRFDF
jgi:hypothetical protein